MAQELLVPFALGLAVFLFGMKAMELGLYEWAGRTTPVFFGAMTKTPLRSLTAGLLAAVALQSSDAVTAVAAGLANAGVLTMRRAFAMMLGANAGGSFSWNLLGVDSSGWALPLLVAASSLWIFCQGAGRLSAAPRIRRAAARLLPPSLTVAGFSVVLIGMARMTSLVSEMQEHGLFVWFVEFSRKSEWSGLLAGALATAAVRTEDATTAVISGLVSVEALPLPLGLAAALGAVVGSCSTAVIAAVGGSPAGIRAALSLLALNAAAAALLLPFTGALAGLLTDWGGTARENIAAFQTTFSVFLAACALPFFYLRINTFPSRSRPS